MKVAQVISCMAQESSGVQSYLASMCNALVDSGVETSLYTCGETRDSTRRYQLKTFRRERFPMYSLARSPMLKKALAEDVDSFDIVQSNGLWQFPNVYPAQAVRGHRAKLVTMPHGTLSKWALGRSRLKKQLFGWFCGQFLAIDQTDLFVATCEKEMLEIRACGYRQPIAVVPIGLELPDLERLPKVEPEKARRRVVFLGRIHPVKGCDNLLKAWHAVVREQVPLAEGWELVFAGPDCGAQSGLEEMIARHEIPNVRFVGELHGEEKYIFLRDADICVLPSHTENFGITAAEALACETPVIATKGTPWSGLSVNSCGWWVEDALEPLTMALKSAVALPRSELMRMGSRGREWMRRDFSWDSIGAKMKASYEWLVNGGDRPDYVIM